MEKRTMNLMIPSKLALMLLFLTLAGCTTVRLVSDYDEVTDKSLTEIQKKTDDFIENLSKHHGTSATSFDSSKEFYEEIERDLRILSFRVGAVPNNKQTIELVENLKVGILGDPSNPTGTSLKELHQLQKNRDNGIPETTLRIAQRIINQLFKAALSLEIAKKRGEDK